jgi:hypothetical protein
VNATVALRASPADFAKWRAHGAEQNGADGYPVDVVDGVRQNVGLVYLVGPAESSRICLARRTAEERS